MRHSSETLLLRNNSDVVSFIKTSSKDNSVGIMSHRRSLRFAKTTCPICGSKEVARDDHKGDLLCTNCGHIIVRTESRAVGKYDIAQHIKRNGKMTFSMLKSATGASDDKLFGVLRNMVEMGLLTEVQGSYSLTKKGNRWYRQRQGQEWGY
jgi:transcription initiation factor TFIIIB Brf1 subunit/transcription initiation factor TFIIB